MTLDALETPHLLTKGFLSFSRPLHNAILQGFLEVALRLIKISPHPCLLDIVNDEHLSPLHLAVITHQARIVRSLVLAGANPGLRNGNGNTALHLACSSGDMASAIALTDPLSSSEKRFAAHGRPVPALPQDLEQRNYEGEPFSLSLDHIYLSVTVSCCILAECAE